MSEPNSKQAALLTERSQIERHIARLRKAGIADVLCVQQLNAMILYRDILTERISLAGDETTLPSLQVGGKPHE